MTPIWQELLTNIAVVALFNAIWTYGEEISAEWSPRRRQVALGLLMGVGTVIVMLLPFDLGDGIRVDTRASFIAISAFFGGPIAGLITGVIGAIFRITLGGQGAIAGLVSIGIAVAVGATGRWIVGHRSVQRRHILMFAAAVGGSGVLSFFALPQVLWMTMFAGVGLPVATIIFVATVLSGLVIVQDNRRRELAKSNTIYRAVIDALPDCLNVKDLDGKFITANPATAALMRAAHPDQLIGKSDFDFYPEETAKRFRQDELVALQRDRPETIEQPVTHTDGSTAWLWTLKAPLRDEDGRVIGLITHNRDVTDLKALGNELARSQQQFIDATTYMADGLVIFDEVGRIVYCNEQYRQLFPRTADIRIPGTSFRAILRTAIDREEETGINPDDVEAWIDRRYQLLGIAGERTIQLGEGRWIHARTCPTPNGGSLILMTDITEKRRIEDELRSSELRWNFALEGARQGVWDFDARTGKSYYSKVWKDIIGYSEDEIGSDPILWLDLIHPEDREAAKRADEAHLRGESDYFEAEFRMRHKDGHWVWVLDRGKVLEADAEGRALRVIGTHTDITVQREADAAIRASEERFRLLFELSPVGIALLDMETTHFLMQSNSLSEMVGIPLEAFPGLAFADLFAGDLGAVPDFANELSSSWQIGPLERDLAHQDGRSVPVIITGTPVVTMDGSMQILLVFQDISARRTYEQQLKILANRDMLTGLPNRLQFNSSLDDALLGADRTGEKMAIALFDLDHFKDVNDTFGHDAGDELLRQIATRATSVLRSTDVLARLGGDEFVVIFTAVTDPDQLTRPLDSLLDALREPMAIGGSSRQFSASVGVALYPDDATDGTGLLKQADIALYRAKEGGRNRYAFFKAEMQEHMEEAFQLLREVEEARASNGLTVQLMPIISVADMTYAGAEAKVTLLHPRLGPLTHDHMVAAVKDANIAQAFGQAAISYAIKAASGWNDAVQSAVRISIELNSALLRMDSFAETLLSDLAEAGVATSRLAFVVREDMTSARGADRITHKMQELHDLGFEIVLDQFGKGKSSVTSLLNLPIGTVGVADSLVGDISTNARHEAVVTGLIELAHRLKLKVRADGVKSREQFDILAQIGCDFVMGSLFGPMPDLSELATTIKPRFPNRTPEPVTI